MQCIISRWNDSTSSTFAADHDPTKWRGYRQWRRFNSFRCRDRGKVEQIVCNEKFSTQQQRIGGNRAERFRRSDLSNQRFQRFFTSLATWQQQTNVQFSFGQFIENCLRANDECMSSRRFSSLFLISRAQDVEANYLPHEDEAEELEIKEIQLRPQTDENANTPADQRSIARCATYTRDVRSAVFI